MEQSGRVRIILQETLPPPAVPLATNCSNCLHRLMGDIYYECLTCQATTNYLLCTKCEARLDLYTDWEGEDVTPFHDPVHVWKKIKMS